MREVIEMERFLFREASSEGERFTDITLDLVGLTCRPE